jgi:valyl-tRNA synthetase
MVQLKSSASFCNKIWQASRFLLMAHERWLAAGGGALARPDESDLRPHDRWILSRCAVAVGEIHASMSSRDFHAATRSLRRFLYSNLFDVYLVRNLRCRGITPTCYIP